MLVLLGASFLAFLFLGAPAAFAMLLASIVGLIYLGDLPGIMVPAKLFGALDSFPLMAVPFFILAGEIMNQGGITVRIVAFAQALVGHLRGGLAQVNVMSNMLMAGISGSAAADASAIGSMLIPSMRRAGYPAEFSVGLTAAASTMGPIIPPSILMVIYAGVTRQSVGALFLAGVIPGVMIGLSLMILVGYLARRRKYSTAGARASARVVLAAAREAFWALLTPVIIIGGILSGVFTATEAGALACVYAIVVGSLVYRELRWDSVLAIFVNAATTTAVSMTVLAMATVFGFLLARGQFSTAVVGLMTGISTDPAVMWLMIVVVMLLVGMFVESLAAMLIFIPVLLPLAAAMGYDELHFALVFLLLTMLGAITPPVGLLLYITCAIGNVPVAKAEIWPFVFAIVAVVLLVIVFPPMVTFIPRLVFGS
jgi:C4-dicarboxylate transporter DctM subunit